MYFAFLLIFLTTKSSIQEFLVIFSKRAWVTVFLYMVDGTWILALYLFSAIAVKCTCNCFLGDQYKGQ